MQQTRQRGARVQLEEVGGSQRYDSGHLSGSASSHRVSAPLLHGRTYRWRVRVWDGTNARTTSWTSFRTDFLPAAVKAVSPRDGALVESTPALRWSYEDADGGQQASYRIWLDDDADHTRVIGDTKELNIHGAHLSPHTYPVAMDLLARGALPMERIITHRLPLDQFQQGIDLVGAGEESIKVILDL